MFAKLQDKLQSAKQDLSTSFRELTLVPERSPRSQRLRQVNINAGAEILNCYQTQWQELHRRNEENAKLASDAAKLINDLDADATGQHSALNELINQLHSLPQIEESVAHLEDKLKRFTEFMVEAEGFLTILEDQRETEDQDKLRLDHQYQLAVYKEKRAGDVERLKVNLAKEHTKKVQEYERHQQAKLKERQDTFQAAFEEELNMYKTQGKIERQPSTKETVSALDEIEVETDEAEEAALAKFLDD